MPLRKDYKPVRSWDADNPKDISGTARSWNADKPPATTATKQKARGNDNIIRIKTGPIPNKKG